LALAAILNLRKIRSGKPLLPWEICLGAFSSAHRVSIAQRRWARRINPISSTPSPPPDFINAVAAILTQTNPRELLQQLQDIERKQGRERSGERWGPRTLDLDLLAYGGEIINEDDLILPHPRIGDRNFVLLPWQEIAPNYQVPGRTDVAAMAAGISASEPRIERIG
jgi:2-amino-4-hydroxy-6-hydroxymethyldihydropteridine diphosphokinase